MDVFALQDRARRSSRLLVALYLLLVVALIAAVDQLLRLAIGVEPGPALRGAIAGGLALLILGGSLWRLQQLRRWGGAGVLTALGARRVTAADPDPLLKRLHNVVEEMAIAAGLPVPAVYLIDDSAINALAAGFGPQDAAIGVTRGALELLDRDELQGVVAHEFAHILNGDMRLNLRLIGLQHGLLMLQLLGRHLALAAPRARRQAAGLYALGFALQTLGLLGAIAGGLLRAAVSRQREFLADAAAVQFTRQPQGIAGALKKIGGWVVGSRLGVPGAQALAHCFIAEAVGRLSSGLLATHPPLSRRIRRLDPHWDGRYPSVQREPRRAAAAPPPAAATPPRPRLEAVAAALAGGAFGAEHLDAARRLLAALPETLLAAAHDPLDARAVILALAAGPGAAGGDPLERAVATLEPRLRLPLLDLCLHTLRDAAPEIRAALLARVAERIRADGRIEPWEWALHRLVELAVDKPAPPAGPPLRLARCRAAVQALVAAVALAPPTDPQAAAAAQAAACRRLGLEPGPLTADAGRFKAALNALRRLHPLDKPRLLHALATAAAAPDGTLDWRKAELLRAIAETLDCPAPPLG